MFPIDPTTTGFGRMPDPLDPMGGGLPLDMELPDPEELNRVLSELPPDPSIPIRPRPTAEVLLDRKRRMIRFWRPRNLRMLDDERIYKLLKPVEDRLGGDELPGEMLILNDPFILTEKVANMLSSTDPGVAMILRDPGQKTAAQKVQDFLYWWRDEANERWQGNLNNSLSRDELYYLCLRGWLCGRIMLDPGDSKFPWRYDLIDPMHVFPQKGNKGLRWVFNVYRDSKINVLNDMGWSNDVLLRIEQKLSGLTDEADVEIASFFDDVWHVMFLNEEEIWSAPHNYGFVPWIITIAYGPPVRRVDPVWTSVIGRRPVPRDAISAYDYTRWWGVSIFQGIKDVYQKMNKLASAILTEAMKAPNPPVAIFTNQQGEAEGKVIDTSAGATNYLVMGQENFQVVQYGFKPSELMPLLQLLTDARNRGALPSVMYGEGTNYLSGFAVSLLQAGSRDLILPLIRSHEFYLQQLFKAALRLFAEFYPFPVDMVSTQPQTGDRVMLTTITSDEVKSVGYSCKVTYKDILPKDSQQSAATAAMLVDKKIISLDTARGDEYLNLKNPILENDKVLADLAFFDPEVIKALIPLALIKTDPEKYLVWLEAEIKKAQMAMLAAQQGMPPPGAGGPGGPPGMGGPPGGAPPPPGAGPPHTPPSQIPNGPGFRPPTQPPNIGRIQKPPY